ncbi:hypothetical protein C2G38_2249124 [Gigaspora rosea]|uniref:Protein kinase domain-containing protein n=1 Tax=Gigaspora rosea TaxID=44941 RepID=A0A397UT64_9GLOM|nr:hypothetical protein C2G38_2249124 [Gigaspora rosea]
MDISKGLLQIHRAGYVHGDFHSDNILQNQYLNGDKIYYIANLGLSERNDGLDFRISTRKLPYYDIDYDENLAMRIFNGLRSEFAKGIPESYCLAYDIDKQNSVKLFKNGLIIKESFGSVDLIIPTSLTDVPNFSRAILTSKLPNFQNYTNPVNSSYGKLCFTKLFHF